MPLSGKLLGGRQNVKMFEVISGIKALTKWDTIRADNTIFRLHYKATFAILVVAGIIVTTKQYVGDPIDCVTSEAVQPLIDQFCWIHSTYTVARKKHGKEIYITDSDSDLDRPWEPENTLEGVSGPQRGDELVYHRYYQWVCFVLFFQAVLFYLPRWLWRVSEGGRLKSLLSGLKLPSASLDGPYALQRKNYVVEYFLSNRGHFASYSYKFFLCELINLINVLGQMYLTDRFLGYEFSTYGLEVLTYTEELPYRRRDPMSRIFPKVTKCTFNAYGIAGSIVPHDAICVLTVNNINEKIYIFLWFWFIFLAIVSALGLIYRVVIITCRCLRFYQMRLQYRSPNVDALRSVVNNCSVADWFVLYQMGKNMSAILFSDIVIDLASRMAPPKIRHLNHHPGQKPRRPHWL